MTQAKMLTPEEIEALREKAKRDGEFYREAFRRNEPVKDEPPGSQGKRIIGCILPVGAGQSYDPPKEKP